MRDFTQYLQQQNLSQSTQKHYKRYVNLFLQWYEKDVINTTKKDILAYLSYLQKHKQQQNITRRNNLIALNHYFTFLLQNKTLDQNPTVLIKIRGTQKKQLYNIFTYEQLQELADNYYQIYIANYQDDHIPANQRKNAYLSKWRNYTMLTFLAYQGLHTNELQNIKLNDIDIIKATIIIQAKNKSNKRKLHLQAEQIGVLTYYIQNIRPQFTACHSNDTNQLFLPLPEVCKKNTETSNLMGTIKPLTQQTKSIHQQFSSFKQIRASVISYWIKTYGLRKAQYMAGHRYISSTEKYIANDLEQLTDEIQKYNPFTL